MSLMLKMQKKLWQSTLEYRSGSSLSLTSPWLLARLLAVQSGTETQVLNKTMLLRRWRGTWNFEASLHRASTDAPFPWFPWGNTQIAKNWLTSWRSSHRDILHPSLFHNIRNPDTGPRCRIFRWCPDSTNRIPLLLCVLHQSPPIKSLTHTPTDFSHHLRPRRSLHVAPWIEDSAVCDPLRHGRRFSQHGNPWVWKEAPLREMRTPHKILNAKDCTLHFILTNHHPIQIDDEPHTQKSLARAQWELSTGKPEKEESMLSKKGITTLLHWSRYILWTDAAEHENQPANNRTTGHHLCQGDS